jgi:hypothetical protein
MFQILKVTAGGTDKRVATRRRNPGGVIADGEHRQMPPIIVHMV